MVEKLRAIPLELVMERMGATPDPADPKRNYLHPAGRITVTGERFYNHTQGKGGGGAIDLTMHLGGLSFVAAIDWLNKESGQVNLQEYQTRAQVRQHQAIQPRLGIPDKDERKIPQVIRYLQQVRGFTAQAVKDAISNGNLWADENGNCVFALRNMEGKIVGAELRGTYEKPFHGARGEKSSAFYYTGTSTARKAIFTESAIDAESYNTLKPGNLVIGTNGSRHETLIPLVQKLQSQGFEIVLAFDRDKAGLQLTENISKALQGQCTIDTPHEGCKDWNDQLRATQVQKKAHSREMER